MPSSDSWLESCKRASASVRLATCGLPPEFGVPVDLAAPAVTGQEVPPKDDTPDDGDTDPSAVPDEEQAEEEVGEADGIVVEAHDDVVALDDVTDDGSDEANDDLVSVAVFDRSVGSEM